MALAVSALVPLVAGAIWYNPKVFGTAWMRASGITEAQVQSGNMAVIFGLTYALGFFASLTINFLVIHQAHVFSALMSEPGFGEAGSATMAYLEDFMSQFGDNYRTFKHGALHGTLTGITFALPIIGIVSLFERKGWAYIGIHAGYWTLTLALMGGIISAWQ